MTTNSLMDFKSLLFEMFLLVGIAVLVPVVVMIDFKVLGNELGEISITEQLQEIILFFAAVLMFLRAKNTPELRATFILIAGFFACLFVREFDFLFDRTPISWAWVTSLIAISCIYYAWQHKSTVLASLLRYGNSRSYVYIVIGLVFLVVFSRLFGSGGFMWKAVMGDAYTHVFKTVIQEGLELYGYGLIALGVTTSKVADWLPKKQCETVPYKESKEPLAVLYSSRHQ